MEELLHTRHMTMKASLIAEDMLRITGRLTDDRADPSIGYLGDIHPAGTIHDMSLEIDVRMPELVIEAARATMHQVPQPLCAEAAPWVDALVGLSVRAGITREIMNRLGGPRWCAHLRSLVLAMTQVVIQGDGAVWQRELIPPTENPRFHGIHLNGCHVLRDDGKLPPRFSPPSREPALASQHSENDHPEHANKDR